jgi:hypothetical protein
MRSNRRKPKGGTKQLLEMIRARPTLSRHNKADFPREFPEGYFEDQQPYQDYPDNYFTPAPSNWKEEIRKEREKEDERLAKLQEEWWEPKAKERIASWNHKYNLPLFKDPNDPQFDHNLEERRREAPNPKRNQADRLFRQEEGNVQPDPRRVTYITPEERDVFKSIQAHVIKTPQVSKLLNPIKPKSVQNWNKRVQDHQNSNEMIEPKTVNAEVRDRSKRHQDLAPYDPNPPPPVWIRNPAVIRKRVEAEREVKRNKVESPPILAPVPDFIQQLSVELDDPLLGKPDLDAREKTLGWKIAKAQSDAQAKKKEREKRQREEIWNQERKILVSEVDDEKPKKTKKKSDRHNYTAQNPPSRGRKKPWGKGLPEFLE